MSDAAGFEAEFNSAMDEIDGADAATRVAVAYGASLAWRALNAEFGSADAFLKRSREVQIGYGLKLKALEEKLRSEQDDKVALGVALTAMYLAPLIEGNDPMVNRMAARLDTLARDGWSFFDALQPLSGTRSRDRTVVSGSSMIRNLQLWTLSFLSKLRRRNPVHEAAAQEEMARARRLAQELIEKEKAMLASEGLVLPDKAILSFELQFLWGVFHELVKEYPSLPTNGFDRIKLHLISRLMNAHGYSFEAARAEATSIEDLYNGADNLFDALASLGRTAFHDPRPGHLLKFASVLQQSKASPVVRKVEQ